MQFSRIALLSLLTLVSAKGGGKDDGGKDDSGGGGGGGTTTGGSGHYKVTVGGKTYESSGSKSVKASGLAATGLVTVSGVHVNFVIDTKNLGVYNYTLTGYPDSQRLVVSPTIVFSSKVPTLSSSQLSGNSIDKLEVDGGDVVILFKTKSGKFKVQTKDAPQGGIFQMETEFAGNIEFTHILGPTLFYFVNDVTKKINFGDGLDAVSQSQSATGYHQMLLGKDSPQVANKTYQDGSMTKWSVASGGRLGGVLGEDATEMGAGATNCTSKCQAQNRIKGSIPPSADPSNPTPLPTNNKKVTFRA